MTDKPRDDVRLDQPREAGRRLPRVNVDPEVFGRASERFARFMGTPQFLIYMSVFCAVWWGWNTFAPTSAQFDPRALNYTLLTLLLSLQASYAAPLILLAQNRQDDRDRVALEQDRARDERGLADTEYLTREVAALRIALRDVVTRDYLRSELRELLEEIEDRRAEASGEPVDATRSLQKKSKQKGKGKGASTAPRPETTAVLSAPPEPAFSSPAEPSGTGTAPDSVSEVAIDGEPAVGEAGGRPEA